MTELLNVGVIDGTGYRCTVSEQIEAAVAHMSPVSGIVLDKSRNGSGPWIDGRCLSQAEVNDILVRSLQQPTEEKLGILDWPRCEMQQAVAVFDENLGCGLTTWMPPHTIRQAQ